MKNEASSHDLPPVFVHLVGVSGYARLVLESLLSIADKAGARLLSAAIINREEEGETCRMLEGRGCRIYSSYTTMLEEAGPGANLCIIPTSIHQHAPMSLAALRAGFDVLVEKPLAGSPDEALSIVKTGQMLGRLVSVGYQDMYCPQVWEIKSALAADEIGAVRTIRVTGSWPRSVSYYERNRWAGRTLCDGKPVFDSPINNGFAHFLNLALFFAGKGLCSTASVDSVTGHLLRFFPIETFDTAVVTCSTVEGVEIKCLLTHAAAECVAPSIQIEAERGSLKWKQEDRAILCDRRGAILRSWLLDREETNRRRMIERVITRTRERVPSECPASMALHHVEVIGRVTNKLKIEQGREALKLDSADPSWEPVPGLFSRLCDEDGPDAG